MHGSIRAQRWRLSSLPDGAYLYPISLVFDYSHLRYAAIAS